MKVLFIGYGSIAKRHIANLGQLLDDRREGLVIDLVRRSPCIHPPGIEHVFESATSSDSDYDVVFITNPTSLHYESLLSVQGKARAYFIEKPVFDRLDYDISFISRTDNNLYYVACPMRYTRVLRWLRQNVDLGKVRSVRALSSSYLPDWRPGVDYRQVYSSRAALGGGVHVDLIHEWDYVTHMFGFPRSVHSVIAKRSILEIDSADTALYIGEYFDKTVEIHLDYFGRVPRRTMELLTDDEVISCDLIGGLVRFERSGTVIPLGEERNSFQKRELKHFLELIQTGTESDSDIEQAMRVLALAWGELL